MAGQASGGGGGTGGTGGAGGRRGAAGGRRGRPLPWPALLTAIAAVITAVATLIGVFLATSSDGGGPEAAGAPSAPAPGTSAPPAGSPSAAAPPSASAPPSPAGGWVGDWQGTITQSGRKYVLKVSIREPKLGEEFADAEYTPLGCTTRWTLTERTDRRLTGHEAVVRNTVTTCVSGDFTLDLRKDGGLDFAWNRTVAVGTLTRQ